MKLSAAFLFFASLQIMATGYAQNVTVNLKLEKTPMRELFMEIERQTELSFIFSDDVSSLNHEVTVDARNKNINDVLTQLFDNTDLGYRILNEKLIVIASKAVLQQISITGTVSDANGESLPGVNVSIKGTSQGTVTNANGAFSLTVPNENTVLTFSYVGFTTQDITVGSQRTFTVIMQDLQMELGEVVVVAYGTAKKKDLTGSISTIDNKLLLAQPSASSSLSRSLEGAIPGLQVQSVDGQPGQDMAIRIRGIGTATQNNSNPLFVVDGVAYSATEKNIFTTINPQDVESMVVLKDAASGAMYGARGANGVIVITTKKGKQGKAVVNFEGKWGVNMAGMAAYPDILDNNLPKKYEYAWRSIYNQRRYGSSTYWTSNVQNPNCGHEEAALFASQHLFNFTGSTSSFGRNELGNYMLYTVPGIADPSNLTVTGNSATLNNVFLVGTDGKLNPQAKLLFNDDWRDLFFEKKFRQEYNISASGATDKIDYYISGSYLGDPSYLLGSRYERYNFRSNINAQVFRWLKAGVNMSYGNRVVQSYATRGGRNPGDVQENLISWLYEGNTMATAWRYDKDGKIVRDPKTGEKLTNDRAGVTYSPLGETGYMYSSAILSWKKQTELDRDIRNINDFNTTGYLEASFLQDFKARVTVAIDKTYELRDSYRNNETGRYRTEGGALARRQWGYTNIYTLQTLSWGHDYGKHHVDALAGHEYTYILNDRLNYVASQGLIPGFDTFANFIAINQGSGGTWGVSGGDKQLEKLDSYLMRVNYNFDDRYLITGSLRTDGSSKFKYAENRYGVFWSLGGAWRLIGEEWAKNISWLNDLKLRTDYGVIGNQNGIPAYSGYQTWTYGVAAWSALGPSRAASWTLRQGDAVNDQLTWEKVHTFDVGLDFRVLKRLSGSVDWYQRQTNDMLWSTPLSVEMGQENMMFNSAAMRTRGLEVELNMDLVTNREFLWSLNVNGAHYKSILTKVPAGMGNPDLNGMWIAGGDSWSASGTGSGGQCYLRGEGKPYYNIYMVKYMGVDQTTGLPLYSHLVTEAEENNGTFPGKKKGDIVATTRGDTYATKIERGDATPKVIGGFGTSFSYKSFDLNIQFAYQIGGLFYSNNYGYLGLYHGERIGAAVSSELWNNTWSPTGANANPLYSNTSAKFPIQMYGGANARYQNGTMVADSNYTDLNLFDASYLSIKSVSLGYSVPKSWTNQLKIERVRAFVTLDNMWFFTTVSGIDPRMDITGGFGVGAGSYPYMRNASFGLNITF